MREKVEQIFILLERNNVRYYLLRPINLNEEIKDIDIIIPKQDLDILVRSLIENYKKVLYKKSRANKSIQLLANDILLDIKFCACFLKRKSLVLTQKVSYAGIKLVDKDIIIPNSSAEILFTFWTFHVFLDKRYPGESSTFHIYKKFYQQNWKEYMDTDFFNKWLRIIFKAQHPVAREKLEAYFENGLFVNDVTTGNSLKKLVLKNDSSLQLKCFLDKIKYGLHRHLGINENYRTITEITY